MDVAGIGRKETAISKVLAFFLDSTAEHGMGDLWIGSLLAAAASKNDAFDPDGRDLSAASCVTEDVTRNGKRIDIVVKAGDLALGIENKIGAKLYNDLGEYAEHIEEVAGSDRRALLITLTVNDEAKGTKRHEATCVSHGVALCNVLYSELFDEVRERLGGAYMDADTNWLVFMRDFMRTLEDMGDSMTGLDEELFRFVGDNKADFEAALDTLEAVADQQRAQSQALCAIIEESGAYEGYGFSAPATYLPSEHGMWCTTFVSAKLRDSRGEVHPAISNAVDEMLIRCWCSRKSDMSTVRRHLTEARVETTTSDKQSLIVERLPLTAPLDELVEAFETLLEKLAPIVQ